MQPAVPWCPLLTPCHQRALQQRRPCFSASTLPVPEHRGTASGVLTQSAAGGAAAVQPPILLGRWHFLQVRSLRLIGVLAFKQQILCYIVVSSNRRVSITRLSIDMAQQSAQQHRQRRQGAQGGLQAVVVGRGWRPAAASTRRPQALCGPWWGHIHRQIDGARPWGRGARPLASPAVLWPAAQHSAGLLCAAATALRALFPGVCSLASSDLA